MRSSSRASARRNQSLCNRGIPKADRAHGSSAWGAKTAALFQTVLPVSAPKVASPRVLRPKAKALSRSRVDPEISCRLRMPRASRITGLAGRRRLMQPEGALVVAVVGDRAERETRLVRHPVAGRTAGGEEKPRPAVALGVNAPRVPSMCHAPHSSRRSARSQAPRAWRSILLHAISLRLLARARTAHRWSQELATVVERKAVPGPRPVLSRPHPTQGPLG